MSNSTPWCRLVTPLHSCGEGALHCLNCLLSERPRCRVKVYVGETGSLRARHRQYLADGDHLRPLFDATLGEGCIVLRRYRYVVSPPPLVLLHISTQPRPTVYER